MLKLLNLVLDFLDHRVDLLAEVHHLQDIFTSAIGSNTMSNKKALARRAGRNTTAAPVARSRTAKPLRRSRGDFNGLAIESKFKLLMIGPFGGEGLQTIGPMPQAPFVQVRTRKMRPASEPLRMFAVFNKVPHERISQQKSGGQESKWVGWRT
jgi:hypothetical protein